MKKHKSINWDIIHKKITGKLSVFEEQQFQKWLNASSENRRYFEQASGYYKKKIEELDPELVPDTTLQFLNKLSRRAKVRKLKSNLRIAASIILPFLLVGGAWFSYQFFSRESREIAELSPIAPISNKAQLVTTSGDVMTLADFTTPELVDSVAGIHILNDSLTGLKYPGEPGTEVKQEAFNTLITPRGGEYKLTLSDGTKVWLNCDSELKYPVAFNSKSRRVILKGEAFFDVTKSTRPFIVETADLDIRVLGTRFNVTAYANEPNVQTTLTRGRVVVETGDRYEKSNQVVLQPGEQAEFNREASSLFSQAVDTTMYVGWVNGYFRFEDKPLDEVLRSMSRWYDINYTYDENVDSRKVLSGRLNREDDFDVIMNLLSKISGIIYERDGNNVIISGTGS